MLVKEILTKSIEFFRSKGFETPRLDAELLLAQVLKFPRIDIYLRHDQPLTEAETDQYRQFILRRSKGEPVAYILKSKWFYDQNFFVDSRVLIPRPETEELVELTLGHLSSAAPGSDPLVFVDLGCGSGAIGISIAKSLSTMAIKYHGFLIDKSPGAIEVAKINAERLLPQADDVKLVTLLQMSVDQLSGKDFGSEFKGVDFVVSNPPYIGLNDPEVQKEVDQFEPHQALYAGVKGTECFSSWLIRILPVLKEDTFLIFEMGASQGPFLKKLFDDQEINGKKAFHHVTIQKDLSGRERFILAFTAKDSKWIK